MTVNCGLSILSSPPGIFLVEAAGKVGMRASQQAVGHCKSLPFSILSEVEVIQTNTQAGGAEGSGPLAGRDSSGLRKVPVGLPLWLQKQHQGVCWALNREFQQ